MPVARVIVKEIEAKRGTIKPGEKISIEVTPGIKNARIEGEVLRVDFELKAGYGSLGSIKIGGEMVYVGEKLEDKVEDGRIKDAEIVRELLQRCFYEPLALACAIAKEIGLPLPVRVPEVRVEKS